MTWYVLTTTPGVQHPKRVLEVETTRSRKGYRIVTSIDPRVSAIERELSLRGIAFYMPSEFKVVRNRRKTGSHTIRRFPLLSRYIFVSGHADWYNIPGVAGRLHSQGKPLELSVADMMTLRTVEAHSEEAAERFMTQIANDERAAASRSSKVSIKAAKRRFNPGSKVKILWGSEAGRAATILGWSDDNKVKAIVERLDSADEVDLPYEFIRLQNAAE